MQSFKLDINPFLLAFLHYTTYTELENCNKNIRIWSTAMHAGILHNNAKTESFKFMHWQLSMFSPVWVIENRLDA